MSTHALISEAPADRADTHVAAAEEVILFTGALGLAEEVQADGYHEYEIGYEYGKLNIIHKNPSLFRYMK